MTKKRSGSKKMAKKSRGFRLIPITITMLGLVLAIKANELYIDSQNLREVYGVRDASAEEKKPESKPAEAKKADAKPAEEKKSEGAHAEEKAEEKKEEGAHSEEGAEKKSDKDVPGETITYGTGKTKISDIEAMKAREATPKFTQNELDLLQNLSKRREELDQREKDIALKAKVLDASEKQLSDKIAEMKTVESEMKKVLALYDDKQSTQIKSLVKIYENMKPADAANIFNEMQMSILLEVIDKMSERKVAPVLAAMDPKKARDITQELAAMRRSVTEKMPAGGAGGPAKAPAKP